MIRGSLSERRVYEINLERPFYHVKRGRRAKTKTKKNYKEK